MKKINLAAVPATEARSPKGRFRVYSQDILTAMRETNGDRGGGLPFAFEVKLIRLSAARYERALSFALRALGFLPEDHRPRAGAHAGRSDRGTRG